MKSFAVWNPSPEEALMLIIMARHSGRFGNGWTHQDALKDIYSGQFPAVYQAYAELESYLKFNTKDHYVIQGRELNGMKLVDVQQAVKLLAAEITKSITKKPRIRRKKGEHKFLTTGSISRCITCGADEDAAFVGGEECIYGIGR